MILVTLGTQDKSFVRLLEGIDKAINAGFIKDRVVVQAGYTKYDSKNMEILDLIPIDKFDDYINECDILITHGGVGSIITGLKHNKKIIAVPRLSRYLEHMNDHQLQIVENFSQSGYILGITEMDELNDALKKIKNFKPKKYKSNTNKMIKLVSDYIDNN